MRISPLLLLLVSAEAFNTKSTSKSVSTGLFGTTKSPPAIPAPKSISYGEESRAYRRTVYSHDEWVKHRSPDRFLRNFRSLTRSGIYKNIGREVLGVTLMAAFVVFWNMATGGFKDFTGAARAPILTGRFLTTLKLPMTAFTLSSPSLGLLLGFRTNQAYKRWDEARKNWGMNINHTRDLVRMGNAFYDRSAATAEKRKKDLEHLSVCTWAFVRAMKRHLSPENEDEILFKQEIYDRLPTEQADALFNAAHRPNRALFDLSMAIENLPMHFLRKNQIQSSITVFENNLGSSERLLTSPIPLFYTRHTARFLSFWLLLLPFALHGAFASTWNHIGLIPAVSAISVFLLGIEELSTQMEEPFTILPMQAFCDKIGNWCKEIVSWEDGDNGITTRAATEGHSSLFFEESFA